MSPERHTRIRRQQIADIAPKDVNAYAINEFQDGYAPVYDSASGKWKWVQISDGITTGKAIAIAMIFG